MIQHIFSRAAIGALAIGLVMTGCGDDYSDLDNEYSALHDSTAARYTSVSEGLNDMQSDLGTVTVADDWDESRRASYNAAQTRMQEYNRQLQERQQQMNQWDADLEAAKEQGREAYEARLNEARIWYNEYNAWLDELERDVIRYRELSAASDPDPWWVTIYTVTPVDTTASGMDGDGSAYDEEADGIDDDVEAVKDAAKDTKDAVKDAAKDVKEGFRDVIGDDDND